MHIAVLEQDKGEDSFAPGGPSNQAADALPIPIFKFRDSFEAHAVEPSYFAKTAKAAYNARLGVTLALMVLMTFLEIGIFAYFKSLRPYLIHATIAFGLVGVVLFYFRFEKPAADSVDELSEEEILRFYRNPGYWAFTILVSAALTFATCTLLFKEPARADQPKPTAPRVVQEFDAPPKAPASEPQVAPPEFPSLHLTGIVLNGANSSAIINRITVHLGEMVDGVTLVSVLNDTALVEKDGFQTTLPLEDDVSFPPTTNRR